VARRSPLALERETTTMHEWTTLTTRYGRCIRTPSRNQLQAALEELFASQDEAHPDCWIACGSTGLPLHTLSLFSSGLGHDTKYSDAAMNEGLISKEVAAKHPAAALVLWERLIDARFEEI
jgi:hypothetical protein